MNIFMWSGPRNLSTALLRSFENRLDTKVWDEPLYAYYLNETKKNHPLKKEIIEYYETNIGRLLKNISEDNKKDEIFYQKHMTHHVLNKTPLEWIKNGINCFLIRNPKDVLLSYIKKNTLNDANDLGFPMQIKIFNLVRSYKLSPIVINANDLASNPEKLLKILCEKLEISFSKKMLKWPKGKRKSDGLWGDVWYQNVKSSTCFDQLIKNNSSVPLVYKEIYKECELIYNKLNLFNVLNGR